ncbi:unnamed protein product [Ectocarpus sp. CCAP 1310/34]|nr:unnamed protein product [Ectocarpus sp. CCAP 1310/34]
MGKYPSQEKKCAPKEIRTSILPLTPHAKVYRFRHALRHKETLTLDDVLKEVAIEYKAIREKWRRGKAKATPLVEAPAVPGNRIQWDDSGGSVPRSPHSGGGDFRADDDFNNPTASSSSSNSPDDDGGGGNSCPGDAGGSEPGDPDKDGGGGREPGEDSENLEEYKFDPADSCYPPEIEGNILLWGTSSAGQLRHALERGGTRKQTRELQGSEEAPNPEEALLATALETGRRSSGTAFANRWREMQNVLQSNDPEQQAFDAEVEDHGFP